MMATDNAHRSLCATGFLELLFIMTICTTLFHWSCESGHNSWIPQNPGIACTQTQASFFVIRMVVVILSLWLSLLVCSIEGQVRYPVTNDPFSYYEYDSRLGQFVTQRCPGSQTFDSLSAQCIGSSISQVQQTVQFQQPVFQPAPVIVQQPIVQQPQVFSSTFNFVQIPGLDTACGALRSVLYSAGAPVTCQDQSACILQGGTCTGAIAGSLTTYCCIQRATTSSVTVSPGYSIACTNYGSAAYRNNQIWPCESLADINECLGLQRGSCQRDMTNFRWFCCFQSSLGSSVIPIGDSICQTFGYVMRVNGSLAPCFNCMDIYGGFCLNNPTDQQWYCCSWSRQSYSYSSVQQTAALSGVGTGTCPDNTIGPRCNSNMQCQLGLICSNYICCPYVPTYVQVQQIAPAVQQTCADGSVPVGVCGPSVGCNVGFNCEAGFVCCANRIQQPQTIITFAASSGILPLTNDYCPVGMTVQMAATGVGKDCRQGTVGECMPGYSCIYGAIRRGYYCCR